jgi:hypothetical protein
MKSLFILFFFIIVTSLQARTLRETDPEVYRYDVLFTNPTCGLYKYPYPVQTQSGGKVYQKPRNAFCSSSDASATYKRDGSDPRMGQNESPQRRLVRLINDPSTRHIFMTYLSFSDSKVANALCDRLANKSLKLSLIIDKKNEEGSIQRMGKPGESLTSIKKRFEYKAKKLTEIIKTSNNRYEVNEAKKELAGILTKSQLLGSVLCGEPSSDQYIVKRMAKPGGIGWSHTKVFMVNPEHPRAITIAFSSANMSSGTSYHHENWHFVRASRFSHFVGSHLCLMEAEFNHASNKREFANFMKYCRNNLKDPNGNIIYPESDIKTFFTPGEGEAAVDLIVNSIKWSKNVDLAAHRFTLPDLKNALRKSLQYGTKVRMVFDDDLYLAGENRLSIDPKTGKPLRVPNMGFEYGNVLYILDGNKWSSLASGDNAEARYMETNHFSYTIHHNKYLIFDNARNSKVPPAVFAGAGNFTKAAFFYNSSNTNLENYYYITIPEVVEAFRRQYDYKWNQLATEYKNLPLDDVKPKKVSR